MWSFLCWRNLRPSLHWHSSFILMSSTLYSTAFILRSTILPSLYYTILLNLILHPSGLHRSSYSSTPSILLFFILHFSVLRPPFSFSGLPLFFILVFLFSATGLHLPFFWPCFPSYERYLSFYWSGLHPSFYGSSFSLLLSFILPSTGIHLNFYWLLFIFCWPSSFLLLAFIFRTNDL